jgi:DNA-binding transcriptional regulator YdaS (Cro superfamily)
MNDSDIIDSLGGTSAVARLCDIKPPSVSDWRKNGIPKPWRHFFAAMRPELRPYLFPMQKAA